jgi:murein tripeptide amidase MpaA
MSESQRLIIRIKKTADGRSSLSCTRPDGSATWQSMKNAQAAFFPRHDLTHYAVETVLGHRRGFYGLVASGWDLTDFGTPWPRGPLPRESVLSEMIVGFLDLERASGEFARAADVNQRLEEFCTENGLADPQVLTDDDLSAVRRRRGELFATFDAVEPGGALELVFELV